MLVGEGTEGGRLEKMFPGGERALRRLEAKRLFGNLGGQPCLYPAKMVPAPAPPRQWNWSLGVGPGVTF